MAHCPTPALASRALAALALASAALGGCAAPDAVGPAAAFYRCDAQFAFTVRFIDGTAVVDAGQGREVLVPAGSAPRSDVAAPLATRVQRFANRRVAIDFFREAAERGRVVDRALVRFTDAAYAVRCVRDD